MNKPAARRRAVILVSHDQIRELLKLPENVSIVGLVASPENFIRDEAKLVIEGSDLPESCEWTEGMEPLQITPQYDQLLTEHRQIVFKGFR